MTRGNLIQEMVLLIAQLDMEISKLSLSVLLILVPTKVNLLMVLLSNSRLRCFMNLSDIYMFLL